MKIGIIDVGGGYRGIYAAGILDYCMDQNIKFDLGIGISAGSANIISYAANQRGRNYKFYTEFGLRKEYASALNFIKKRSFVDLDYVYSTLSNSGGEYPLDYEAILANKMEVYIQAIDAYTAKPHLFTKNDIKQDDYSIFKASSALPVIGPPVKVKDRLYFDGGIVNPIPYKEAFEMGCDKLVVLLTLPINTELNHKQDVKIASLLERHYPSVANKLKGRSKYYRKQLRVLSGLVKSGKVLIVYPDDVCGVTTLCRDFEPLDKLYHKGYKDGEKIKNFLNDLTNNSKRTN